MTLRHTASLFVFASIFAFCSVLGAGRAFAQSCPAENPNGPSKPSAVMTATGRIIYHDGLRHWFGLRLDTPVCGQSELQLIAEDDERRKELEMLRGCRAAVAGVLDFSPTMYYSANIYQVAHTIKPDSTCVRRAAFPAFRTTKPNPAVQRYRVKLSVSHVGEGAIHVEVRMGQTRLTPPSAYVSYRLTGGYVLWGNCADNFSISHVSGTPAAQASQMDNEAEMDAEPIDGAKSEPIAMMFTCTRDPIPTIKNAAPK